MCVYFFLDIEIFSCFLKRFQSKSKSITVFFFFFFISLKIFETVLRSTMSSSRELFYELIIWLENHSEFVLYIVVYYLKTISRKHLSLCFRQTLFYAHKTFFFFFFTDVLGGSLLQQLEQYRPHLVRLWEKTHHSM